MMQLPTPATENPIKTTCPYCGVGCGVIAQQDQPNTIKVSGDKEHPANYGRLCSKGSSLHETIDLEHRLLHPMINQEQVSWDAALDTVAEKFNQTIERFGKESVAFYVSGQLLTEDYYAANKLMKGFIGTANIDTNSRLCMSSAVAGHIRAFGSDTVGLCYEDLEETDVIVLIGSNIAWCHPVLFQRIEKVKQERDLKFIVVDPRQTSSCDIADVHLKIRPGTDATLFNGLLAYLDNNNGLDKEYIDSFTNGFAQTLQSAKETADDIDAVSKICDIDKKQLIAFYELFMHSEKLISFFSMGINQSSSGVDKVNAIINAHLATGKIGKPGMGAFSITGQPNAMGGREVGGLASTLAAHMAFDPIEKERVKRFWNSPNIAEQPGLKAVDLFKDIHAGKVKAVWIMATNPVVSLPDADFVREALQKCELVVVSDVINQTDTTVHADILLPAQAWGEKSGTVTNSERRISRQRSFLTPAGEAKPDWWIISEVAKRMGFNHGFDYQTAADIFREHAALSHYENNGERDFDIGGLAEINNDNYDSLDPVQWPVLKDNKNGTKRLFETGKFFTPDQKARFIPITPLKPKSLTTDEYPLVLNTGRVRDHWHTMTRTGKSQRLSRHIKAPFIQIHPDTASEYELEQSGLAKISSHWGTALARVEITERQRQGELFMPIHWNDQFAASSRVDSVVNPHTDAISGQPEYKHTPVIVHKVEHIWHGFMLSRSELDLHGIAYWSKFREDDNWHYDFSDAEIHNKNWIKDLIGSDANYEWIEYQNELNGSTRYFWFNESGLQGCVFISTSEALISSREWLSKQFTELAVENDQRTRLLYGLAGSGQVDTGPVVCSCFNVGKNSILDFIAKSQPEDIELIGEKLKAGTNCGSCRPELKFLLQENTNP